MRIRRLQQLLDNDQWEDHGYAFEREDGQCLFSYNTLIWGRIGAELNVKLEKTNTRLEDVQQIISATQRLRWLEIEEINGDPEDIKANLDEACKIPRPQRISTMKPVVA